ncbi:MAG: hypothetical protein ACRCWM_04255 [Sarcina sp.]
MFKKFNNLKTFMNNANTMVSVANNIVNATSEVDWTETKKNVDNIIKYVKEEKTKESIVKMIKALNSNISDKYSSAKSLIGEKGGNRVREVYLDQFAKKFLALDFTKEEFEEIKIYEGKVSEQGFEKLRGGEVLYRSLKEGDLDDYTPVYIMYTKFLETTMADKINYKGKNPSFWNLIEEMEKEEKWHDFIYDFRRLQLREKRNLAAHGGEKKILFSDVKEIRGFILEEKIVLNLSVE